MRCLALLVAARGGDFYGRGSVLEQIVQVLWVEAFPGEVSFFIYAEFEAEPSQRGLPYNIDINLVAPHGSGSTHIGTADVIAQMPLRDDMPPIVAMRHEIGVTIPAPGRYELELHIDGELAGHRPVGFYESP